MPGDLYPARDDAQPSVAALTLSAPTPAHLRLLFPVHGPDIPSLPDPSRLPHPCPSSKRILLVIVLSIGQSAILVVQSPSRRSVRAHFSHDLIETAPTLPGLSVLPVPCNLQHCSSPLPASRPRRNRRPPRGLALLRLDRALPHTLYFSQLLRRMRQAREHRHIILFRP